MSRRRARIDASRLDISRLARLAKREGGLFVLFIKYAGTEHGPQSPSQTIRLIRVNEESRRNSTKIRRSSFEALAGSLIMFELTERFPLSQFLFALY